MSYEGFLWLVKALLFLKEDFSFFPSIHSSLYSRQIGAETKKEETLTSNSTVENTLCGFLTLLEKGHT